MNEKRYGRSEEEDHLVVRVVTGGDLVGDPSTRRTSLAENDKDGRI